MDFGNRGFENKSTGRTTRRRRFRCRCEGNAARGKSGTSTNDTADETSRSEAERAVGGRGQGSAVGVVRQEGSGEGNERLATAGRIGWLAKADSPAAEPILQALADVATAVSTAQPQASVAWLSGHPGLIRRECDCSDPRRALEKHSLALSATRQETICECCGWLIFGGVLGCAKLCPTRCTQPTCVGFSGRAAARVTVEHAVHEHSRDCERRMTIYTRLSLYTAIAPV